MTNQVTDREIIESVKSFIMENFIFDDDSITIENDDSFMDRGIIDSTGILELIDFLESNYSIEFEDDDLVPENLDSLSNIARFVKSRQ